MTINSRRINEKYDIYHHRYGNRHPDQPRKHESAENHHPAVDRDQFQHQDFWQSIIKARASSQGVRRRL